MNDKIYFKNVPNIGNLFFKYTMFEYDNIPIVFICRDSDYNLYLCWCTDAMFGYCCMIMKISKNNLFKVIMDIIPIYQAFKLCKENIVIVNYIHGNYEYSIRSFSSIPSEDLPCEDEYLELEPNERNKLINELTCYIQYDTFNEMFNESSFVNTQFSKNSTVFSDWLNNVTSVCHHWTTSDKIFYSNGILSDYSYTNMKDNISDEVLTLNFILGNQLAA